MSFRWPWGGFGPARSPREPAASGSSPAVSDPDAADPLRDVLVRNRGLLVGGYLFILAVFLFFFGAFDIDAVVGVADAMFGFVRGDRMPWVKVLLALTDSFRSFESVTRLTIIAAYVGLQGVILWGGGKVLLDRKPPRRWRMLVSMAVISALAAVLIFGAFALAMSAMQTAQADVPDFSDWFLWSVFFGGWLFWFAVAAVYWRGRDPSKVMPRIVAALLAGSWIEFSLALPIDITIRDRTKDCPCATGSWYALILAIPIMIWAIGPALFLLYRREKELSLVMPGRATAILRAKSKRRPRTSPAPKVGSYVSTARTLSLVVIVLGYVGLQLGTFNSARAILFSEARDLVAVRWLHDKYFSNDDLSRAIVGRDVEAERTEKPSGTIAEQLEMRRQAASNAFLREESPFGTIELSLSQESEDDVRGKIPILGWQFDLPPRPPFSAIVKTHAAAAADPRMEIGVEGQDRAEQWQVADFSLNDEALGRRLDKILGDLNIDSRKASPELISEIREKLYNRRVKVPGVDFGEFGTEAAVWLIAFLCPALLVVLRNAVRQILRSDDGGLDEPWLILDAQSWMERAVGAAWLLGIFCSGWLTTFGLILTAKNVFDFGISTPGVGEAGFAYVIFLALLLFSTWPAFGAVLDILRLREIRREVRRELDGEGESGPASQGPSRPEV